MKKQKWFDEYALGREDAVFWGFVLAAIVVLFMIGCSGVLRPNEVVLIARHTDELRLNANLDPGARTFIVAKIEGRTVTVWDDPNSEPPAGVEPTYPPTDAYENQFGRHAYFGGWIRRAALHVRYLACAGIDSTVVTPRDTTLYLQGVMWHDMPIPSMAATYSYGGERLYVFKAGPEGLTALVWTKGNDAYLVARAKAWPLPAPSLNPEFGTRPFNHPPMVVGE